MPSIYMALKCLLVIVILLKLIEIYSVLYQLCSILENISHIGASYVHWLFRVWVVHVGKNVNFTWLYLCIQISLVLVMFSPVSMATNGKD